MMTKAMNATKIECGPTLADPSERQQERRIDRGDQDRRKKSGRSGR